MADESLKASSGGLMQALMLGLIRFYQRVISPLKPPTCRFYPTCSAYAYESIVRHGVGRGSLLTVSRLCRCHPFHPGGLDPVPPVKGLPDAKDLNHPDQAEFTQERRIEANALETT